MTRRERVLVTGSSGLIGGATLGHLRGAGHPCVGIDVRPGPATDVVGDLSHTDLGALDGCDAVVHCAALHAPHVGRASEAAFVATNVAATERLLAAARRAGVARFVFVSTTSVYGHAMEPDECAVWVDESLAASPRDIYDVTKLQAESLVALHHGPELTTITLRIARCFPEPAHTTAANRLYRGVDLRDTIHAVELALSRPGSSYETLNIAGPRHFDRDDLRPLLDDAPAVIRRRLPGVAEEFARRGWPLPASIDRVYVSDRAAEVIGYRPAHGMASALACVTEP